MKTKLSFKESQEKYVKTNLEIDRLELKIKRFKVRKDKLQNKTHWTDDLIRPLINDLKPLFPEITNWDDDRLTPMGLMCRVSVFPKYNGKSLYLPFLPGNLSEGELRIETKEIIEVYPDNSIGAWNGMGKGNIKIDSVEQVAEILRNQIK